MDTRAMPVQAVCEAVPAKPDSQLVGNVGLVLALKVMCFVLQDRF